MWKQGRYLRQNLPLEGETMATYVQLNNFTEQGLKKHQGFGQANGSRQEGCSSKWDDGQRGTLVAANGPPRTSAGPFSRGVPIVAQTKTPGSTPAKIVMATSLKCIGSTLSCKFCETLLDDLYFFFDLSDRGGQVEGAV